MFAAMRPSPRAGLLLVVLSLVIPSSASADTTVPPGASVQTAVTNAGAGETITIQGAHTEDVTVDKQLTLVGVDNASLTGSLTSSAAGVVVKTLSIATTAGTPVSTSGSGGLTLANLLVQRTGGSAGTPLIAGGGSGGLTLTDVIGINTAGPALSLTSAETLVQRATLATTEAASDAVDLAAGAAKLTVDSSMLIGGGSAAGLKVTNTAPATALAPPAAITVALRHATVTGSKGIVLDAT
ncbi:MAG: hypothetical protein QOE86_7, partial [Solirubrobacteraceae bacterium]|nr:hypothetical protein [Solirubrobacteraceae bacterium]